MFNLEVDWNVVGVILSAGVPLGVVGLIFLVRWLRKKQLGSQLPGPLTLAEVRNRLDASGISLAEKRELASRFAGQRVRWPSTFVEVYENRGGLSALCRGEPHGGQFFFDPAGADGRRLVQTPQGTRLVVEGTLRVDLNHDLLTLDAPVVRFDL